MKFDELVLFEVNDLHEFEPIALEGLGDIDRRTAVKSVIASRVKRRFKDHDDGELLDRIKNPTVLREPALLLNLSMVFGANAGEAGEYRRKSLEYANRFEIALSQAMDLLAFDGVSESGIRLVR